jgi:hypothetical protein
LSSIFEGPLEMTFNFQIHAATVSGGDETKFKKLPLIINHAEIDKFGPRACAQRKKLYSNFGYFISLEKLTYRLDQWVCSQW